MVEAIIDPSKVVSDQYKSSIVQTADGKVITGRIISDNDQHIIIVTDPEDATKFVTIQKDMIEEIFPGTESLMPKGLLNQLNEEEVLDLLAYTLSKGNKRDGRFRKKK